MPPAARLWHVAGTRWGARRYMDMSKLCEPTLTRMNGNEEENQHQAAVA